MQGPQMRWGLGKTRLREGRGLYVYPSAGGVVCGPLVQVLANKVGSTLNTKSPNQMHGNSVAANIVVPEPFAHGAL